MDVAVEDAVAARRRLAVVERQRNDVLEKGRLLKGLHGRVQIALVREVDALEDGPLGVEQVALVALAGEAVGGQVAVGAGARPAPAAQVETQLLATTVAPGTGVGSCVGDGKRKNFVVQTSPAKNMESTPELIVASRVAVELKSTALEL